MSEEVVLGIGFAFAAAAQPGPLQAYLVSQTLTNGLRRTIPAAFAPILSDIPIAALVLVVLTNIPPQFVLVLQFVGGGFLLYLAFEAYKSFRRYKETASQPSMSVRQTFFKGVLVNILNPNAYMGWALIMGPLVATAWHHSPLSSLAVVGAFYATMILTTIVILALFARVRAVGPRVARILIGISAVALALFGLYQVWSGATACVEMLTGSG